ncbi:MAG: outer membrane beta-barrel protein [Niabella sp.]
MKRKLIIGALALLTTAGMVNAQTKVGLKGGYNLANITYNKDGEVDDKTGLSAFHVGIAVDAAVTELLSIKTGLELQSKGSKYTATGTLGTFEHTVNPMYIELPVNLALNLPLGGASKLYVGAGPYAAVGIAGKDKWKATSSVTSSDGERNIEWGNDDPSSGDNGDQGDFKRFDAGVNVIGGIDFGKFAINAQYGIGLVNTYPGGESNSDNKKNRNRVLGIGGIFYF